MLLLLLQHHHAPLTPECCSICKLFDNQLAVPGICPPQITSHSSFVLHSLSLLASAAAVTALGQLGNPSEATKSEAEVSQGQEGLLSSSPSPTPKPQLAPAGTKIALALNPPSLKVHATC